MAITRNITPGIATLAAPVAIHQSTGGRIIAGNRL